MMCQGTGRPGAVSRSCTLHPRSCARVVGHANIACQAQVSAMATHEKQPNGMQVPQSQQAYLLTKAPLHVTMYNQT